MRTMNFIYTAILMAIANLSMAQSGFEGVISMNTTNEALKETASITWYLKGENSRMDFESKAGEHSSRYALIADEKGMDLVAEGHVTKVPNAAPETALATQTSVSEMDGVSMNGYHCKQVVYTDGKHQTTYWLTDALGISFNHIPFIIRKNMPAIASSGFPIKMEKRDATGKVVLSQNVNSVKAQTVDASKFERK